MGEYDADLRIFPDEFVSNVQASKTYQRWAKSSPGDRGRWEAFRDALLAGQEPSVPSMSTTFGRALVAAGKEHMSISTLVGTVTPPFPSPPPSPPPFPSSYYTGPLGQQNILPASDPGALFILWTTPYENSPWSAIQTQVQIREQQAARTFDGIGIHYGGGGDFQGWPTCSYANPAEAKEQWVHNRGSVPVVSWTPDRSLADINAGNVDGCIRAMADYFKGYGFRIMLRPFWEFNLGPPIPVWGGTGSAHISAWRRFVTLFNEQGADNVGFFWCPQEGGSDRAAVLASYPGDAYVDWVGSDNYNFTIDPGGYAYPYGGGWAEFGQVFHYLPGANFACYHDVFGGGQVATKPFIVGETGTTYDPANATRKGNWYRNIAKYAQGQITLPNTVGGGMSYLKGVQFFDQDVSIAEPGNNWNFHYPTSQPDALAGAIEMMRHAFFNVGVSGGAT